MQPGYDVGPRSGPIALPPWSRVQFGTDKSNQMDMSCPARAGRRVDRHESGRQNCQGTNSEGSQLSQQVRPLPVHKPTRPNAPGTHLVHGIRSNLYSSSETAFTVCPLCHRTSSKQNSLKQLPALQLSFLAWIADQLRNDCLSTLLNDNECLNTSDFIAKLEPVLARLTDPDSTAKRFKKSVQAAIDSLTKDKTMQDVCAF